MRFALLTLAFCSSMAIAAEEKKADADKGLKEIEGEYTVVQLEKSGAAAPAEVIKDVKSFTIKGNKLTIKMEDKEHSGAIKVDSSKSPKHIDLTPDDGPEKGKTFLGIYKVESGKVTLCFDEGGKERPADFKTADGDKRFIITLKKAKD